MRQTRAIYIRDLPSKPGHEQRKRHRICGTLGSWFIAHVICLRQRIIQREWSAKREVSTTGIHVGWIDGISILPSANNPVVGPKKYKCFIPSVPFCLTNIAIFSGFKQFLVNLLKVVSRELSLFTLDLISFKRKSRSRGNHKMGRRSESGGKSFRKLGKFCSNIQLWYKCKEMVLDVRKQIHSLAFSVFLCYYNDDRYYTASSDWMKYFNFLRFQ